MPSLQLGHQCCKWVCRECVPNRHNLLCSCLEAFPKPSRKSTSRDLNLLLCTDAILRDPPRCLLHRLHERYVLSALAGYHSCFRMISEKTISLWQSEFVILSNHLGCLQNFSRWQRFVDKCFVSQVISFSATVAILINWTYNRVCQDWKYCLSIQWVLLSELTAAFIVLEMKRGWCECVYALIRRKWWRQRKGLGREAGEEERGYKGAMMSCPLPGWFWQNSALPQVSTPSLGALCGSQWPAGGPWDPKDTRSWSLAKQQLRPFAANMGRLTRAKYPNTHSCGHTRVF